MTVRFRDLPVEAQEMMEQLIAAYIRVVGKPPGMSDDNMRHGLIYLIERGEAVFVQHAGEPPSYSIKMLHPEKWRSHQR